MRAKKPTLIFNFIFNCQLEAGGKNTTIVENAKSNFGPAVVTLTLITVKTFIFKDFNFTTNWHDKGVAGVEVKTNNEFNLARTQRSNKIINEEVLVLLAITQFKQISQVNAEDSCHRSAIAGSLVDFSTGNFV